MGLLSASWGLFGALESHLEAILELLKAILALLKTIFRPRRQATAYMSGQKRENLNTTLIFLKLFENVLEHLEAILGLLNAILGPCWGSRVPS